MGNLPIVVANDIFLLEIPISERLLGYFGIPMQLVFLALY
jgi:hypothetical protein